MVRMDREELVGIIGNLDNNKLAKMVYKHGEPAVDGYYAVVLLDRRDGELSVAWNSHGVKDINSPFIIVASMKRWQGNFDGYVEEFVVEMTREEAEENYIGIIEVFIDNQRSGSDWCEYVYSQIDEV